MPISARYPAPVHLRMKNSSSEVEISTPSPNSVSAKYTTLATWIPRPAIIPARCPRNAACDMMNMTLGPGARLTSVVSPMNNSRLSGI